MRQPIPRINEQDADDGPAVRSTIQSTQRWSAPRRSVGKEAPWITFGCTPGSAAGHGKPWRGSSPNGELTPGSILLPRVHGPASEAFGRHPCSMPGSPPNSPSDPLPARSDRQGIEAALVDHQRIAVSALAMEYDGERTSLGLTPVPTYRDGARDRHSTVAAPRPSPPPTPPAGQSPLDRDQTMDCPLRPGNAWRAESSSFVLSSKRVDDADGVVGLAGVEVFGEEFGASSGGGGGQDGGIPVGSLVTILEAQGSLHDRDG